MTCVHLQQLYKLCREYDLRVGGSDLIRVVCHQCGVQEVCPSTMIDQSDDASETAQNDISSPNSSPREAAKK